MSASKEKNTRNDSVITKNTAEMRNQQDAKKDRNFYIKCIAAVAALAIAFVVCFLYSNDNIRKNMAAVTVDGEKYTAVDLNYYYYTTLDNARTYLSYFGVDANGDLDAKEYADGESWGDYFRSAAVDGLTQTVSMYNTAMENGYEIDEELQGKIDAYSESVDEVCAEAGMTREQFLQKQYGSKMTDEIFMKHLTMMFAADDYSADYKLTHEYTADEMQAYYDENKKDIDLASYEVLTVNADYTGIEGKVEGSTDEEPEYTAEQDAQAMEAARATAEKFLNRVNGGEKLSDIGDEFGEVYYTNHEADSYASFTQYAFNDWVFDDTRTEGEASVVKDTNKGCWYAAVLNDRYRPDYSTVDVRHILIQPVDSGLKEGDEGFEEAEKLNKAQAKEKAETVLNKYLSGEHTAEAFGELAKDNSADGSAANGGLISRVYKNTMVDSFEDWCFDASRTAGDTGIVESDYGYHVMYFQGENLPYWQVRCINGMNDQWTEDIYTGASVKEHNLGIKAAGGVRN